MADALRLLERVAPQEYAIGAAEAAASGQGSALPVPLEKPTSRPRHGR